MIAGPRKSWSSPTATTIPPGSPPTCLSQAEHDTRAQAILITDDAAFAATVETAVAGAPRDPAARRDRRGRAGDDHGAIIVVRDWDEAVALIDRIAPEHLELAVDEPERSAQRIRHAGAIFLGRYAPEAVGDYVAGPNHVLPTARSARFASGLSVLRFPEAHDALSAATPPGSRRSAPAAIRLAEAEGLDAHALSLSIRLNR